MVGNTTIWTQTNLAQWAENSNRGSWYKYTQASRSFNSYIKSKITTSANLASTIEGTYTPVESWVELDSTQWVGVDRKQWLDLFRGYKSLLVSIFPELRKDVLDLAINLKSTHKDTYDLLATIYSYSGLSGLLNLAAVIMPIPVEITSWTDHYKSQWWSDDSVQWIDFLLSSKDLNATIKVFGHGSLDLLGVLKTSKNLYSDLGGYLKQNIISSIELGGYLKTNERSYDEFTKIIRGWKQEYIDLLGALKTSRSSYLDLNAYTNQFSPDSVDLPAYIKYTAIQDIDIKKSIRGWGQSYIDLIAALKTIKRSYINLNAYTNQFISDSDDLPAYIKYTQAQSFDIKKIIRGWKPAYNDLLNYVKSTQVLYRDLRNFLRGTESYTLVDIPKYIKGTEKAYTYFVKIIRGIGKDILNLGGYTKLFITGNTLNLLSYIKNTELSYTDIGSYLQTIPSVNLPIDIELIEPLELQVYLTVNDKIKILRIYITAFQEKSLNVNIVPFHIYDLNIYAVSIPPMNISASLYGWASSNLSYFISAQKWPELIGSITPVPSVNLKAIITAYKAFGVESNLNIIIGSVRTVNLACYLSTVLPVDLNATLIPSGQIYDLNMQIKPKVIFMRAIIYVALLEHIDLNMSINNGCVSSMYKDLPIRFHTLYYKQLLAYIRPRLGTNLIYDLGIEVNNVEYTVTDFIDVSFFTGRSSDIYNVLEVEYYSPHNFITEDSLSICFSKYYSKDLNVLLQGVLQSYNLQIEITPISLPSYTFSPEWIDLTNKRIVMSIDKIYEQWNRIVELFFDTAPKDDYNLKYIYADGLQKAFKEDRDRFWKVIVTSHSPNTGQDLPQKLNIRSKYLIKLSDFSTVDEAVKYLIDMVSTPRSFDLKGILNVIEIPTLNLPCYLKVDFKYTWSKNLNNTIIGDYIEFNLPSLLKCGYTTINNFLVATKGITNSYINLQNRIGYVSTYSSLHTALKGTITDNKQLMFLSKALYKNNYDLFVTIRYYYGDIDLLSVIKSKLSDIENNLTCSLTSIGYIEPDSTNIIFNFTDGSYTPPEYNDLNFNFVI